ncbi:hypothetical protein GQ44DRAFT_694809 [Phaeosphaeriaceae sp. PMI808]|nr:hypothetical protein GQ44DRAFT_694809 [Phaeosphaeriaceae sp. PMI808]
MNAKRTSGEWKSWSVRKLWTISVLVLNIALAVVILTLERISATKNGIVEVRESTPILSSNLSISKFIPSVGILWTALPSFIMALNRLAWDSIISAAAERQPYVELRKPRDNASNAQRSVMLDYRSYAPLYSWAVALKHGHWVLGCGMALNLILSVFLVPITAYLFTTGSASVQRGLPIDMATTFNISLLTTETDAQPAISAASALWIHGATPPPWITTEYAFEPFSGFEVAMGNITITTAGYSGYLDCELKTGPEASILQTGSKLYIDTNGVLTVSLHPSPANPQFAFAPEASNTTELDPFKYRILDSTLPNYQVFDPTARFVTDSFGRAVFEYARKKNPSSPMDTPVLIECIENIFTSMVAFLTGTTLFQPLTEPRPATAVLSTTKTKLFVFAPVAYTVVAVVIFIAVCNVSLILHVEWYPSCLSEEPSGLLRLAGLLGESNLLDFVAQLRERHPEVRDIQEFVRRRYTWKNCRCYYNGNSEKIVVEGLHEVDQDP